MLWFADSREQFAALQLERDTLAADLEAAQQKANRVTNAEEKAERIQRQFLEVKEQKEVADRGCGDRDAALESRATRIRALESRVSSLGLERKYPST